MKKIIITESQFNLMVESQVMVESLFNTKSFAKIKQRIENMVLAGLSIFTIYSMVNDYCKANNIPEETKTEILSMVEEMPHIEHNNTKTINSVSNNNTNPLLKDWRLADDKTLATVYNAIPAQCNGDFGHTASMFRLDLYNVLSQRVIAMERTFMKELGLKYGDVVYIEGTGKYDGVWQIQDTMNKRFAGQHKIDILVPENVKYGQWDNVKIYTLKDKSMTDTYRSKMAPQVSKQELVKQVNNKKKEFKQKKAQKLAMKK